MDKLINKLSALYPQLQFCQAERFYWSPKEHKVFYRSKNRDDYLWKLLHEVSHALLKHKSYRSDIELLKLEVAAWDKAQNLATDFKVPVIDDDYIQDCLDTYRDWLHKRSTCPKCGTRSLQESTELYRCFNCRAEWRVSSSRFCRTYREVNRYGKLIPGTEQAIFS
jgi:hypothetical protein